MEDLVGAKAATVSENEPLADSLKASMDELEVEGDVFVLRWALSSRKKAVLGYLARVSINQAYWLGLQTTGLRRGHVGLLGISRTLYFQ